MSVPSSRAAHFKARHVGLWAFNILMIFLMYLIAPLFAVAFVVFALLVLLVFSIVFRRQGRRFVHELAEGSAALARGDLKKAREFFWRWAEETKLPRVSALARHGLAWTMMREGELQSSIDVLLDNNDQNHRSLKVIGLFPTTATDLALDYALLGDLVAAEKWLGEAEKRSAELCAASLPAMKAFSRAVLDCRAGRCDEVARTLDDNWASYEATLTGETLRPFRIVRAFAIAAAGPRSAGLAEAITATSRPAYPGEYDFLGVAWPEMATFLATHGLTRRDSSTSETSDLSA